MLDYETRMNKKDDNINCVEDRSDSVHPMNKCEKKCDCPESETIKEMPIEKNEEPYPPAEDFFVEAQAIRDRYIHYKAKKDRSVPKAEMVAVQERFDAIISVLISLGVRYERLKASLKEKEEISDKLLSTIQNIVDKSEAENKNKTKPAQRLEAEGVVKTAQVKPALDAGAMGAAKKGREGLVKPALSNGAGGTPRTFSRVQGTFSAAIREGKDTSTEVKGIPASSEEAFTEVKSRRRGKKKKAATAGTEDQPIVAKSKQKTFASIAKKLPKVPESKPTSGKRFLVIEGKRKEDGTSLAPGELIKNLPVLDNPTGVKVQGTTRAGTLLVEVSSEDVALKVMEATNKEGCRVSAREAGKRRPRMRLNKVPVGYTAEEVKSKVAGWLTANNKNLPGDWNTHFRLISSIRGKSPLFQVWIAEVSVEARFALLGNEIRLDGWHLIGVTDYIDAPVCMRCQGYGHIMKECKKKEMVCRRCGGDGHKAKECQAVPPKCVNCTRRGKKDTRHEAVSQSCPVHRAEAEAVIKRTQYA